MTKLDPAQLRSFRAVVETRHFTRAAASLSLRQSTVSGHVRKLEERLGRMLLLRDTHRVSLTTDGDAFYALACEVLDAHRRAEDWLSTSSLRGRLRFGVSEDMVAEALPEILARFRSTHPRVDLDLTVGLSENLTARLDAGRLDLVCAKRPRGTARGSLLWEEQPVWVASPQLRLDRDGPVPLIVYDDKRSVTRAAAIACLQEAGRSWVLACTSDRLSGLLAAVRAGLGVSLQSRLVLRGAAAGLAEIGTEPRTEPGIEAGLTTGAEAALPRPQAIAFAVFGRAAHLTGAAKALAATITANAERLRPAPSGRTGA